MAAHRTHKKSHLAAGPTATGPVIDAPAQGHRRRRHPKGGEVERVGDHRGGQPGRRVGHRGLAANASYSAPPQPNRLCLDSLCKAVLNVSGSDSHHRTASWILADNRARRRPSLQLALAPASAPWHAKDAILTESLALPFSLNTLACWNKREIPRKQIHELVVGSCVLLVGCTRQARIPFGLPT